MAGEATTSWTTASLENAIRTLRDVEGVNVKADGDDIREIHVLTASNRPAKQIVRDIQTLFATRFHLTIDHRVVSVAFAQSEDGVAAPAPVREATLETPPAGIDARIRYVSANLHVSGPRAEAEVELLWRGQPRRGKVSGWSTRQGGQRLIAAATVAAIQEIIEGGVALSLEGVEFVRLGRREVAVVALELLVHREQKSLSGCCAVEQDSQQAIVLATLNALNRIVGSFGAPNGQTNGSLSRPAPTPE